MPLQFDPVRHEAEVDAYLAKLKQFLMRPDHGDMGWPDISQAELNEAREQMQALFLLKWGKDGDGAMPVKYSVWPRKTTWTVWDIPLVQGAEDELPAACERRLLDNLRRATGGVSSFAEAIRQIQAELDMLQRNKACAKAAIPLVLVRYKAPEVGGEPKFRNDTPVSLHLSEADADAFTPPAGFEKVRTLKRWALPDTYSDPSNNFAEYRALVESWCNRVMPQYDIREHLQLVTGDALQDAREDGPSEREGSS